MKNVSRPKAPLNPRRTIRLRQAPESWVHGLLSLTETRGRKTTTTDYWIDWLPSDFGTAYRLRKFQDQGGESYDVLLDGRHSTCECLGFQRWGHCKHIEGLQALVAAGQLAGPPPALVPTAPLALAKDEDDREDFEDQQVVLRRLAGKGAA